MTKIAKWVERLNWLGAHPRERNEYRSGCAILGHAPSGERLMVNPPIDICWWCGDGFRRDGSLKPS